MALAMAGPDDEVDEPVGEAVVLRVAVLFDPEPDPELPVPVPVGATPVPEALPIPLPAPRDGESPPPDEARGELVATDTTDATDAEMEALAEPLEPPEVPELVVVDGVLLELEETAEQERSKYGVVLKGLPSTIPKLGLVWTASLSVRVYHQVLVLPKRGHPTASQYVLALAALGTARLAVEPLTGHPVSVTQTGFPPTAACVALRASWKRPGPFWMLLAWVVWKYG